MNCPHCGKKVVKYPIKDENGKLIVKNLFKMDFMSFVFLVIFLFLAWSYHHDTEALMEVRSNPCSYCGPYQDIKAQQLVNPGFHKSGNIIELNNTLLP